MGGKTSGVCLFQFRLWRQYQAAVCESDSVDHPISSRHRQQEANELMAHTYAALFQLPCTGLRFFTVYGPGPVDMALFLFTKAILAGEPIKMFNHGQMVHRDFTWDDIVRERHARMRQAPPPVLQGGQHCPNPPGFAPYRVFSISNAPRTVMHFSSPSKWHL